MPPPPKTDAPPAPPPAAAKPDKPAPAPEAPAAAAAAPAPAGGIKAWLPAIVCIVLAPAITWATAEYVLVPRLQKKLALATPVATEAAPDGEAAGAPGKPNPAATYEFTNVVVNLAGTMGTRYLKTSFHVIGDPKAKTDIKKVFEDNRTKLYDTTLNVLSALTLADLEEAGAKNVIREKLVSAYNQALGKRVAEQVYFSDFVVQ